LGEISTFPYRPSAPVQDSRFRAVVIGGSFGGSTAAELSLRQRELPHVVSGVSAAELTAGHISVEQTREKYLFPPKSGLISPTVLAVLAMY